MKKLIYLFLTVLIVACSDDNSVSVTTTPEIGDFRDGGIVFWIDASGQHGLVCAVENQGGIGMASDPFGNPLPEGLVTSTAMGTGSLNTDAIIAAIGGIEADYAAALVRSYNGGGFSDWYLPSRDELNEMYFNKETINTSSNINGGSTFPVGDFEYWSSSTYNESMFFAQNFDDGEQRGKGHSLRHQVRAIRSF